jgi:hypothetical protein
MSLTVTISHPRFVDGFIEAANRNGTTAEAMATALLEQQGKAYADLFGVGVVTSAAFIARFTPVEYGAIIQAASVDAGVKALLDTLLREPIINFDDPRLEPGLQQLVDAELLEPERVPELLSYPRPVAVEAP